MANKDMLPFLKMLAEHETDIDKLTALHNAISKLENESINNDNLSIPINITTTIKKFEGNDTTQEPIETIII